MLVTQHGGLGEPPQSKSVGSKGPPQPVFLSQVHSVYFRISHLWKISHTSFLQLSLSKMYLKKSPWPFSSMEELQQDLKQYCFHSEIFLLPFSSPYPSSFPSPSPGTPGCHAGVRYHRKRAPPILIVDSFWPALALPSCCWKRASHLLHPELRNSRLVWGRTPHSGDPLCGTLLEDRGPPSRAPVPVQHLGGVDWLARKFLKPAGWLHTFCCVWEPLSVSN